MAVGPICASYTPPPPRCGYLMVIERRSVPVRTLGAGLPLDYLRAVADGVAAGEAGAGVHRLQRRGELAHAEQVELEGGHVTPSAGIGCAAAAPPGPARPARRSPAASRTAAPARPPPRLRSSRRCGRAGRCGSWGRGRGARSTLCPFARPYH